MLKPRQLPLMLLLAGAKATSPPSISWASPTWPRQMDICQVEHKPLLQCKPSDSKIHSVFFIQQHWNISITDMKFNENYWHFNTYDDLKYIWSRGCYGSCLYKVKTVRTTHHQRTENKLTTSCIKQTSWLTGEL